MCVSAIAIGMSEQWPLVIAGNRDEFLQRPTKALHEWFTPAGTSVWGGRDEQDGGGWMLTTPDASAVALLTNVRDAQLQRGSRSRGQLTLNWIDAASQGREHQFWEDKDWASYGGFNLLCGIPRENRWWYFSNRSGQSPRQIGPGLYGLSNAWLDSPWPKSERLKSTLADALQQKSAQEIASLCWPELANPQQAADSTLPETGVGLQSERILSSVFIDWPERGYGTRSSHVICMNAARQFAFHEREYERSELSERQRYFTSRSLSA